MGNSFSGGVFLGISLLHLLPESSENLKQNIDFDFPLSYLLAIVGYMTILYIDKVAFDSHNLISHGDRHTDLGSHSHNKREDDEEKRIKHLLNMRIRFT